MDAGHDVRAPEALGVLERLARREPADLEVVHTQGKAELLKSQGQQPGTDNWEKLAYKGTVFLLDSIRTGAESTAETLLEYRELDTVWTLFQNGKIHFTEEEAICEAQGEGQPQQRIAYLDEGDIRGATSRRSDAAPAAALRTKNAVICATGTIFIVRFIPPNTTIVIVLEGTVQVRTFAPASGWVEVEEGFQTEVVDTQPPPAPARLSEEALQRERQRRVIGTGDEDKPPIGIITGVKLTQKSLDKLKNEVPKETLDKLKPLVDKPYTRETIGSAVTKVLGKKEADTHKKKIVDTIEPDKEEPPPPIFSPPTRRPTPSLNVPGDTTVSPAVQEALGTRVEITIPIPR